MGNKCAVKVQLLEICQAYSDLPIPSIPDREAEIAQFTRASRMHRLYRFWWTSIMLESESVAIVRTR